MAIEEGEELGAPATIEKTHLQHPLRRRNVLQPHHHITSQKSSHSPLRNIDRSRIVRSGM